MITGFNPRTPCGVRLGFSFQHIFRVPVSIHALLAECDPRNPSNNSNHIVSIHALLAECDMTPPIWRGF